jgi:hypothetical protein
MYRRAFPSVWSSLSNAKEAAVSDEPGSYSLVNYMFLDARYGAAAYESQSLLLGLDGGIDISASSGVSHIVVSVCRHVDVSSLYRDFNCFLVAELPWVDRSFDIESPRQRFRVKRGCKGPAFRVAYPKSRRRQTKDAGRCESFTRCDSSHSHPTYCHCNTI